MFGGEKSACLGKDCLDRVENIDRGDVVRLNGNHHDPQRRRSFRRGET